MVVSELIAGLGTAGTVMGPGGTAIQSATAWAAYNRDSFADNVAMRQNQMYQKKNYQLSFVAIARDDIRDMMSISVNRINNYMVVATLLLSVAGGAGVSVSFDEDCPAFVIYGFYLSIGISFFWLMMSIMFGVMGQNTAFTWTMKLLTFRVRPEPPASYTHDYMKQVQHLETLGAREMLRIPLKGVMPKYETSEKDGGRSAPGKSAFKVPFKTVDETCEAEEMENKTPLEELYTKEAATAYLSEFAEFMKLWLPYDRWSKYCMGLGIIGLGQASVFWTMGQVMSQGKMHREIASAILIVPYVLMTLSVSSMIFKTRRMCIKVIGGLMLVSGPILAITAILGDAQSWHVYVPLCYCSHFVFWLCSFLFTATTIGDSEMQDWIGKDPQMWSTDKHAFETESSCSTETADFDLERNYKFPAPGIPHVSADDEFTHFNRDFFTEEKQLTGRRVSRMVHFSLSSTALIWFFMLCVALLDAGMLPEVTGNHQMGLERNITCTSWPDPRFFVHHLACEAENSVFLSNRFQIYQMGDEGAKMTPVQCKRPPNSPTLSIDDMTVWCDDDGCRPLVLRTRTDAESRSYVVDCRTGAESLLQGAPATFIAAYRTDGSLLAIQDGTVVQHKWDNGTLVPQYDLFSVRDRDVIAASVSGDILYIFHDVAKKLFKKPLDLFNVRTAQALGSWRAPPSALLLKAGCGIRNGSAALVATSAIGTVGGKKELQLLTDPHPF